jgi:hypothetical protein
MQEKQTVAVEVEVLNKVLEYLSTKPFKEVADLISGVQRSVQENNQPEPEVKPEKPVSPKNGKGTN